MQVENLPFSKHVFEQSPEPNGLAWPGPCQFDTHCDFIVGVGSGTINDIGKVIAKVTGLPYLIVGTAPSMDGYTSATSSVIGNGIKFSLSTVCPTVVVADLEIMCKAPLKLLQAGLGDMLAKYISICEWRLSHLITGEYFCEKVATLVRGALKKCMSVENLADPAPETIRPIVEGLILSGMAMDFAGLSRPASDQSINSPHLGLCEPWSFKRPSDLHVSMRYGVLPCANIPVIAV